MLGNTVKGYYLEPSDFKTECIIGRLRDDRPAQRAQHFLGIASGRVYLEETRHIEGSFFVDVAEIMGGEGRATQLLVRRHHIGGRISDAVMGVVLLQHDEEYDLYRYLKEKCPFVLVMAPQRAGNVEVSFRLGRICARAALLQMNGGRHFLNELPREAASMACRSGLT